MMKEKKELQISVVKRELGIDKLTPVMGFVGGLATSIANLDTNKDGQISLLEGANAIQVTAFEAFGLFREFDLDGSKAQWKDADTEEKKELVAAFAARFELKNEVAEALVEDFAAFFFMGVDLVQRTVALQKSKQVDPVV